MIEIDKDSKKIFFYYSQDEIKKNSRYDTEMHEFDLLSGHVCPECNRLIDGYYVGMLPIDEASGSWFKHPYVPTSNSGYSVLDPHYKYGHKYGGGYLILCNHNDTLCRTIIANKVGIIEGIKSFIDIEKFNPSDFRIKKFAVDILENKVSGVFIIEDVCNQRSPILAIDKKQFIKNIEYNGFTEYQKEDQWKLLFSKFVMGDPDIKITQILEQPIGEN